MKSLIFGAIVTLGFLVVALLTRAWGATDEWMLVVGLVSCLFAALLTGATSVGYRPRLDKLMQKRFNRVAVMLVSMGIQNLVVGVIIYYSAH